MIVFAAIAPHPPMTIPGIGRQEDFVALEKTLHAFDELRAGIEEARPDTIVIISPHAHLEPYSFVINASNELSGSFANFGLDQTLSFKNDIEIADKIAYTCEINEFSFHLRNDFLDHGALVPLYHLTKNIKPKVVHLSFSLMSYERHYRYGEIVSKVIDSDKRRVAVIASGDLSHRLTPNAPVGYLPSAKEFDRSIIHLLGTRDISGLYKIEHTLADEAAECGIRSIMIALGMLNRKPYGIHLLSYEGPYGVGHLTAKLL